MSNIDPSTWNPNWELNEQIEGIPLDADASILDSWKAFRMLMAAIGTHGQTLIQKVSGPSSSVDEHIVLFDGTSGLKLKDSGLSLSDIAANPFTGATASAAGRMGLVPQPLAGDQDKVLRGDGTWGAIAASDVPNIPASKITSGTIDLARLPAGALERLVTVADQTARFALTTASVQLGDTVKQLDTGIMYLVVDTTKLGQAAGYVEYTAGSAASVPWSGVTGKPSSYTPSSHTHGNITNDGKLGTASRVVVTDGSKVIGVSSITTTKLGYLTDVTANIQGQIDGKANDSSVVHKAGDEMTGNLRLSKSSPQIHFQDTRFSKGTNPSGTQFLCIPFLDKNGTDVTNRIGIIESYVNSSGTTCVQLGAYKYVSGSNVFETMGIKYDANGTSAYTFAPNPPAGDDTTKIATTSWVNTKCGSYLPLAGGTLTNELRISANTPRITYSHTDVTKGTNPSSSKYWNIAFGENGGGGSNSTRLGMLETILDANGVVTTRIQAFKNEANSQDNVSIGVVYDKTNNISYTSAPTPAVGDNSTKIATTAWCRTATGNFACNAATATKLATARTINGVSFDGSANITVADSTKVAKAGDTMTGGLTISRSSPYLFLRDTSVERGTSPDSYIATTDILGRDKNNRSTWALYHTYDTDKTHRIGLLCYNGLTTDSSYTGIYVGYDSNGNPYTTAPTPAEGDSTTKIATTYFVNRKCNNYLLLSGGTMTGALNEKPSNVNISVEPSSLKEDYRFCITRSDADTVHNGILMRLGVAQAVSTKDYRVLLGVSNPRGSSIPTQESIARGDDDSDAITGNCWGSIGVYYDYSKNRAYPLVSGCSAYPNNDSDSSHLATTSWVRNATGNFACNAATATSAASATKLFPRPNTSMPTGNLTEDGLQLVEVTLSNTGYPCNYGNVLNAQGAVKKGAGQLLLGWSGNTNGIEHLYYRNKRDAASTWSDWKTIAFTSDDITGNAATATKATQDKNGLQIDTGYLKLTGGTVTGNLSLNGNLFLNNRSLYRECVYTRGVAADSDDNGWLCISRDAAGNYCGGVSHIYYTDKTAKTRLICYRGTTADSTWSALEIGYDSSGNVFTSAPTPSDYDASNKIATTAFVYRHAARHRLSDVTYYVSNASGASGDGSSAENAMSVKDMWLMLSTLHMQPTAGSCESGHALTLKFVRTGTSYGTVRIDAAKMPGVRFLTVTNATGTDSTTSNWSTNSPEFANFYVNGSGIQVTLKNVYVSGTVFSEYHGRLTISGFVGAGRFVAYSYGRIDFADNTVVNVHNTGTDYLVQSYEFGYARIAGNTITFNFREQCYFNGSIFRTDGCGRLFVDYTRLKFTGTQPVVAVNVSGTKTGHSSTAAGTAAKVVTLESGQTFSLAANAVAYVTFDNTNTAANPTLNINNTGAKAIWVNGAAIPAKYLNKHIQYKFTYDGTRYICNNTFQRVEVAGQNSLFQTSGNYDQTYNSGSWNWSGFINWFGTGAVANGIVSGNVTGTSANVTGTVVVGHGGTGATTREDACKNLFQKNMGSSGIAFFLTGTSSFADSGYSSVADVKTILGLKSAAYTESSAYATSDHTHSYLPLSGGTLTGDTFITKDNPKFLLRNSKIVKGVTELESNNFNKGFSFRDANNVEFGAIEHGFFTDKTNRLNLIVYKGTSTVTNDGNCKLSVGFDGNGNWFTEAPTPVLGDNSTKIATTAWVRNVLNSGSSSDERLKTPLSEVPDEVLDAWEAVELGQFKFLDAVEEKGEKARLHLGLVAQQVLRVFNEHGLDACRYGILCHETSVLDEWTVRYTEALCIEAMYQRRRADRLEARIAAIEETTNGQHI